MTYNKKYFLTLGLFIFTAVLSYWKVQLDDAYIYYSYVQNILAGNGFVFNPGEKINAATSPLYTVLLTSLSFLTGLIGITIPATAHIIGGISLYITSLLLFKITDFAENYPLQYFLPVLYAGNPLIRNSTGMEIPLAILFAVLFFYFYGKSNLLFAALSAALAILARFDAALILIPAGADLLLKKKIIEVCKLYLLTFIFILPWFVFSYFYFGELLPATIKIKLIQQSTGYWGKGLIFLKGTTGIFSGGKIVFFSFLGALVLSAVRLFFRKEVLSRNSILFLILVWLVLYYFIYSFALNPPPYIWYYTPLALLFAVVISGALKTFWKEWNVRKTSAVLLILFAFSLILPLNTTLGGFNSKYLLYRSAAEWLNDNSKNPTAAIDEVGILRYYLKRGVVRDFLGLVNPDAVDFLIKKDIQGFLDYYRPNFIISEAEEKPLYLEYLKNPEFLKIYSKEIKLSTGSSAIIIYGKFLHD